MVIKCPDLVSFYGIKGHLRGNGYKFTQSGTSEYTGTNYVKIDENKKEFKLITKKEYEDENK